MNFKLFGATVTVSYPFLAVLTVFFTLDRTGLGGQMFCAALLHELGHLVVMYRFGQAPRSIDFVSFGIRIQKRPSTAVSYGKEIAIYLAGPLVNLMTAGVLLCLAGGRFTQLSLIHLLMGLYNLLPIGALDGGMIVRNLASCFSDPRRAEKICRTVSLLFLIPLAAAGILLGLRGQANITLAVTLIYLAFTIFSSRH
ncbi:site-2 protease family protein [Clostridiaceae bacterium NSJ-31]|uniref:Site-2 protease family protein n=1 Tax=Ligaoa zhengdingensis TaxID=2763658 RepID=A0A926I4R0_9FIRM|nr:site-2 protease family protein [Ligaoa zhengdingensis]MBC8546650.1 site-2 protease family protein [Ligaoa zhengdingensis]